MLPTTYECEARSQSGNSELCGIISSGCITSRTKVSTLGKESVSKTDLQYTAKNDRILSERVRRSEADAGASLKFYHSGRHTV